MRYFFFMAFFFVSVFNRSLQNIFWTITLLHLDLPLISFDWNFSSELSNLLEIFFLFRCCCCHHFAAVTVVLLTLSHDIVCWWWCPFSGFSWKSQWKINCYSNPKIKTFNSIECNFPFWIETSILILSTDAISIHFHRVNFPFFGNFILENEAKIRYFTDTADTKKNSGSSN